MASTKEYLDFILEQFSELDEIPYKAIFDGDFGIVGSDSYLTGWFS